MAERCGCWVCGLEMLLPIRTLQIRTSSTFKTPCERLYTGAHASKRVWVISQAHRLGQHKRVKVVQPKPQRSVCLCSSLTRVVTLPTSSLRIYFLSSFTWRYNYAICKTWSTFETFESPMCADVQSKKNTSIALCVMKIYHECLSLEQSSSQIKTII